MDDHLPLFYLCKLNFALHEFGYYTVLSVCKKWFIKFKNEM